MSEFLNLSRAESHYLREPEGIEPIIKDVTGQGYFCEVDDCENDATSEVEWGEFCDESYGFYCEECLNKKLAKPEVQP